MSKKIIEAAEAIEQFKELRRRNQLQFYKPYDKQMEFHAKGLDYSHRCFAAGNQLGKTYSGAMETAYHLTGLYPTWWRGARFSKPTVGWAMGVDWAAITGTVQRLTVGRIDQDNGTGTGAIPSDKIAGTRKLVGVQGALDYVKVKHVTGKTSILYFKAYSKGRESLQGETIDFVWFDEEPPLPVATEAITRTNNGQMGQFSYMTFTPLKGMTAVVRQFFEDPTDYQSLTVMTLEDVDHYTEEEKKAMVAAYPEHERDARTNGQPTLGQGAIFPIGDDRIACDPFKIPSWWPKIKGIDFGYDHPSAVVALAIDPETDTWYIYDAYKEREVTPMTFAPKVKKLGGGSWIPVAWPHDGLQHDKGSGSQLYRLYEEEDVPMLSQRSTFEDGSNGLEAGNYMLLDRMRTGQLKVFNHLSEWFQEKRQYHRKMDQDTGRVKIVALYDDLLAATRYAGMMVRYAETESDYESGEGSYYGPTGGDSVCGY